MDQYVSVYESYKLKNLFCLFITFNFLWLYETYLNARGANFFNYKSYYQQNKKN